MISAVWFPESELAIASAIGAGGLITGNALGYVIPTIIVKGPVDTYGTSNYPANWADKEAYPDKYEAAQVIFVNMSPLLLNPHTPDRFTPENCGSALTHR